MVAIIPLKLQLYKSYLLLAVVVGNYVGALGCLSLVGLPSAGKALGFLILGLELTALLRFQVFRSAADAVIALQYTEGFWEVGCRNGVVLPVKLQLPCFVSVGLIVLQFKSELPKRAFTVVITRDAVTDLESLRHLRVILRVGKQEGSKLDTQPT